jgi:hypothetical protein
MSTKFNVAPLAVLAAVLATPAAVSAQGFGNYSSAQSLRDANPHAHQRQAGRSKAKVPADAFGSVDGGARSSFQGARDNVVVGGKVVGRDPDPNVRFDIQRDGAYLSQY